MRNLEYAMHVCVGECFNDFSNSFFRENVSAEEDSEADLENDYLSIPAPRRPPRRRSRRRRRSSESSSASSTLRTTPSLPSPQSMDDTAAAKAAAALLSNMASCQQKKRRKEELENGSNVLPVLTKRMRHTELS